MARYTLDNTGIPVDSRESPWWLQLFFLLHREASMEEIFNVQAPAHDLLLHCFVQDEGNVRAVRDF